jgi:bifunctional DNase/RNase
MKLVDLVGLHVEATSGAPLIIVREHEAPYRVVPIVIGGAEAASIAVALSGEVPPRPMSHDLMAALVTGLGARVDRLEVTALRDGAFLAELAVSGPDGPRRLDTRPSDGIALAVRLGAPLYVGEDVLDEAGAVLAERPDEQAIDDAVDEFRSRLEGLDPRSLAAALGEPSPDDPDTGSSGPGTEPPEPDAED